MRPHIPMQASPKQRATTSPAPLLDSRTQSLYAAKRDATYKTRDTDKTIRATALLLIAALAVPVLLALAGLIPTSSLRPVFEWLAWAWTALGFYYAIIVFPVSAVLVFAVVAWHVHKVRHRHDLLDTTGVPITQPTCTFFSSDFVLGQGWTIDGMQPGDFFPASRPNSDILHEPNLFIRGEGPFQNTKLEGAPGTGKSKLLESLIAQAVRKYPEPPPPPRDERGQWIQIPPWDTNESEALLVFMEKERQRFLAWETKVGGIASGRWSWIVPRIVPETARRCLAGVREWRERRRGGMPFLTAATDPVIAAAYGGIATEAEAEARRADLLRRHSRRPTVLVVNAKPESYGRSLVDHVVRAAEADSPGRSAQVYIVSPDLGTSVALFDLARTNADLASTIATTIDILDGETDRFWTGQMTSLVSCLVGVMKAVMPGRINWLTLLDLLRSKERFDLFVAAAKLRFDAQGEAARRNEPPEGPPINHVELSELARFSELDARKFTETTAHILNFGGKLTSGDLVRTIAPEVPTFGTMQQVVREGGLLCIDMPLSRYQDVSRAAVTMLLNAYVAAVMEVARQTTAGEMREAYLFLDEAASFMTPVLERALSQNRSARLGVFLAYQIRTQFDATDTTASETLGTTCANSVSFRDPDGISAEMKSRSYGTHEMLVEDYGLSESLGRVQGSGGRSVEGGALSQSGSVRQTVRDVPRFKSEVVQSLPQGHAIVMVSDGRDSFPARRIKTLRTEDIPWLADVEAAAANSHNYRSPIPLCVLAGAMGGATTDWAALDQLKVLVEASDPFRDDVLAMHALWHGGQEGRDGEAGRAISRRAAPRGNLWGVLLFTRTFACVIESRYVVQHRSLVAQGLSGIVKPGYLAPMPPIIVFTGIEDAQLLARTFDLPIGLPFLLIEAAAELARASGNTAPVAAARTAAKALSSDVADYLQRAGGSVGGALQGVRGVPWFKVSDQMRAVLDAYRDLDSGLRRCDLTLPQHLRAEWADAIGSDGASDGGSDGRIVGAGTGDHSDAGPEGETDPARINRAPSRDPSRDPSAGEGGEVRPAWSPVSSGRGRVSVIPTAEAVLAILEGEDLGTASALPAAAATDAASAAKPHPVLSPALSEPVPATTNHATDDHRATARGSAPATPDAASEPAAAGPVQAGNPPVLARAGAEVPPGVVGEARVLDSHAATDRSAVRSAEVREADLLGIPLDNPFDV